MTASTSGFDVLRSHAARLRDTGIAGLLESEPGRVQEQALQVGPLYANFARQRYDAQAWGALLALGVLCTSVAYVLYFKLIEQLGPARALTVTFLAPVFALLYGNWFLNEPITAWMLGCGVIIVGGTMLSTGLIGAKRP